MADVAASLEDETVVNVDVSVEEGPALTVLASVEDEPDVPTAVEIVEETLQVSVMSETDPQAPFPLDLRLLYRTYKL